MKLIYVKSTFKTPWEERESRFDIQNSFIPVCGGRWKDSYMTLFRQVLLFFCFVWNLFSTLVTENSKIILRRLWVCNEIWTRQFSPTKFHNLKFSIQVLLPTKSFKLASGIALKCKGYKNFFANSAVCFTAS